MPAVNFVKRRWRHAEHLYIFGELHHVTFPDEEQTCFVRLKRLANLPGNMLISLPQRFNV